MIATVAPDAADSLVRRLLDAEDSGKRARLIAAPNIPPELIHDAVTRLVDEAERLINVDPRKMERVCLDARMLAARSGDPYLGALTLMRYGDALRYQGRFNEACAAYDAAAVTFTRIKRPVEAARTRIGWLSASASLGNFSEAIKAARKARKVLLADGQILRVANLDQSVGIINSHFGRYRAALHGFASAQSLYESLGDQYRLLVAHAHGNRGNYAYIPFGRYREALEELTVARTICEEMGATRDLACISQYIGAAKMDLGHYSAALHEFSKAQAAMRTLEMHADVVSVALDVSECYLRLNRPEEALAVLAASDNDFRVIDNPLDVLAAASRRVASYQLLGDYPRALEVLDSIEQKAAAGGPQHRAGLAAQRATVLLERGDYAGAIEAADNALALARVAGLRRLAASILITRGLALYSISELAGASRDARRALTIAGAIDVAPVLQRANELLGLLAEAQGRTVRAVKHYAVAIDQMEREQRTVIFEWRDSFATGRGTACEHLAALQLMNGRPAEALATAERAKSRALADAIAGYGRPMPRSRRTGPIGRLTRRLALTREEYAAMSARLSRDESRSTMQIEERAQLSLRLAELEARIAETIRQIQILESTDRLTDPFAAMPAGMMPHLPSGTALIEFYFSENDVLRFLVDASAVHGDRLVGVVPEIERLMRFLFVNLDATERSEADERTQLAAQARAVLGRLDAILLGGLNGLDQYQSVVIVPHGLLHYLPFHALHDGRQYLIERFIVSYAPSAALYGISQQRSHRRPSGRALVLAHSAGGRLPFVAVESNAVASALNATFYQEDAATRTRLRTEGRTAGLIHIAAHGRFRADAPLFSCIELADGPLTTVDIYGLDLRAGLVSLSACQTARGVLGGGDELAGLTRAFLYAGAARLLVSQWRVDDAATADLITRFYSELTAGRAPAAALRAAQLASLDSDVPQRYGRHPFYWAGFQMIGDNLGMNLSSSHRRKEGVAWPKDLTSTAPAS